MSEIARDLTHYLSHQLQQTIRSHADRATTVLEPADTLFMMMQATVEATCCAIASVAGTLANAGSAPPSDIIKLLDDLVDRQNSMLAAAKPIMLGKIEMALAEQRGKKR